MNKKKAIKLVTASALAASSFAAVAPFNSEAAVSVASSVANATTQANNAVHVYTVAAAKGQVASVAAVQSAVKVAQKAYNDAKAVVIKNAGKQKAAYLTKLDVALKNIKLAQNYITAVNYATGLKNEAVKVDKATQNDAFSSADFSLFAKNLNNAEKTIKGLISEKTVEDVVVNSSYLTYPKAVYNLVNGYSYASSAYYWMGKGDLTTAQARLDSADKYFNQGPTASNLGKVVSAYIKQAKADYAAKLAPKVESISAINDITVENGVQPTLPTTVTENLSDGSTKDVAVTWDLSKLDVNTAGTYALTGTIEGTDATASVNVIVKAAAPTVTGIAAVNDVQVNEGSSDVTLPATVTENLSDGSTKDVSVTWDKSSLDLNKVGTYALTGTIDGTDKTASVNVVVVDKTAPVIALTGDQTVNLAYGTAYTEAGATVTDNNDQNLTATSAITDANGNAVTAIDGKTVGTFTVTYTAVDAAGNQATAVTRTVVVAAPVVSSVGAITKTSVKVTLASAPAADFTNADASKFAVLVNGTAVVPTAVAKDATDATGKNYVLTIPSLDGQEGTLSVNGIEPTTKAGTNSVFEFDYKKPTVTSVQATDNKTIVVNYSEAVDNSALTVGNYTLYNSASGQTVALNAAAGSGNVQAIAAFANADHTQVKITILSVGNTVNGFPMGGLSNSNYILYTTNVNDLATAPNQIVSATPAQFAGTLTPSTAGANVVSSSFNAGTGQVTLVFDKAVNQVKPADSAISFVTGNNTVNLKNGTDYTGLAVNGTTVTFTVDTTIGTGTLAKINALGSNPQIVLVAGAFTDGSNQSVAVTATPTITVPPVLTGVTYNESTNTAVFSFNKTINTSKIVTVNSAFSIAGHTIANATLLNTSNSASIQLKLSDADAQAVESAARVVVGNITASVVPGTVQDTDATPNANVPASSSTTLAVGQGYTKDTVAPNLVSATYNQDSKVLAVTFDQPVRADVADLNLGNIKAFQDNNGTAGLQTASDGLISALTGVTNGDLKTDASGSTTITADKEVTTLYISNAALSTALAGVAANTDIYLDAASGAFKDANTNASASEQSVKVSKVAVSNASAVDTTNTTIGATTVNSITVAFNDANGNAVAMDPSTVTNAANYNIFVTTNNLNKPTIDKVVMGTNNTSATIIFSQSMVAATGYTITTTGLKTVNGSTGDIGGSVTPKTFTSAAANAVTLTSTGETTVDVNNDGKLDAGDTITIPFNEEVKVPSGVSISDFAVNNSHTLGNSTFALSSDYKSIVVTVGSNATATVLDTITLPTAITDLEGNAGITLGTQTIAAPSTDAAPKIASAVYSDTNANGSVDTGDKLVVTFDRNVTATTGATLLDNFEIGGLATHASEVVLNGNQATITLTGVTAADLTSNVTLNASPTVNITSAWNTPAVDATGKAVTYTDTTAPTVTGFSYNSTAKTLTMSLSEAVNLGAATPNTVATDILNKLVVANGSLGSATNAQLSTDGKSVTVTLSGEALDQYSTISVSAGSFADVTDASLNHAVRGQAAAYQLTVTK